MTVLRDNFMMKRVSLPLVLMALCGLSYCLAVAQDAVPVGIYSLASHWPKEWSCRRRDRATRPLDEGGAMSRRSPAGRFV